MAITIGFALGSLGTFGAAFGMGTICTTFNPPTVCSTLNRWLTAGFIGQWVLVLLTVILLTIGLKRPESRRRIAIASWIIVAIMVGWYIFWIYNAYHSYKHH